MRNISFSCAVCAGLVLALTVPVQRAQAMPVFDLEVWFQDEVDRILGPNQARLVWGTEVVESVAFLGDEDEFARSKVTVDTDQVRQYADTLPVEMLPPGLQKNWVAKTEVELKKQPSDWIHQAAINWHQFVRGDEKWVVYAISPNSASGSGSAGTTLRYKVDFFDGVPSDTSGLQSIFLVDTDLADGIAQINQGHFLMVDLDVKGVGVGQSYGLHESVIVSASQTSGTFTFLLDPISGTAIPEPAGLGLLILAGLVLCRHRRRSSSDSSW